MKEGIRVGISKRAWFSLLRNYKQTAALLLAFFLLGLLLAIVVITRQSSQQAEANLRRQVPPIVLFSQDMDWWGWNLDEAAFEVEFGHFRSQLYPMLNLALTKHLQETDFNVTLHQWEYSTNGIADLENYVPAHDALDPNFILPFGVFPVFGHSQNEPLIFQAGVAQLMEGRFFQDEEMNHETIAPLTPVMISYPIAALNGLSLGSTFTLSDPWAAPEPYQLAVGAGLPWNQREQDLLEKLTFEMEVIGIFDMDYETTEDLFEVWHHPTSQALNTVLVPWGFNQTRSQKRLQVFEEAWGEDVAREIAYHPFSSPRLLVLLEDPLDLEAFLSYIEPFMPEGFAPHHLLMLYQEPIQAFIQLNTLADQALLGATIATVFIVALVLTFFLKERWRELGIYLALGERKRKVMCQILLEVVLLLVVAVSLSLMAGNLFGDWLAQELLLQDLTFEMTQVQEDHLRREIAFFVHEAPIPLSAVTVDEVKNTFDFSLGMETILTFYTVAFSATVVSTSASMIYLFKLDPKKLLL